MLQFGAASRVLTFRGIVRDKRRGWHPLPPCVLRTALFSPYVLRIAIFRSRVSCVPFNNKNNIFWRFHLHEEDKMTVCCMHMHNHYFLKTLAFVCLRVRFPSFRPSPSNVWYNSHKNTPSVNVFIYVYRKVIPWPYRWAS